MSQNTDALRLYGAVMGWLKPVPWKDIRHLQTLAWMVVGLLLSSRVALSAWTPHTRSRAMCAQSRQRRFARWLNNRRIPVLALYGALLQHGLADFQDRRLYLILDTTVLWNRFCVVYVALAYRGRMIPLAWKVLEKKSASVAFREYRSLLVFLAPRLAEYEVCLLADRGFVHRQLMRWVKAQPGWHFRIRYKKGIALAVRNKAGRYVPLHWACPAGRVACYHGVYVTGGREAVDVVVGWDPSAKEPWIILSDEPTGPGTLTEYGRRFHIEEGFLDQKSNGFQWEDSRVRDRFALRRLCFVMAVATLILVAQGSAVVEDEQRRRVDPHWQRGHSYMRIGWDWIRAALAQGLELMARIALFTAQDPEPARASKRQANRSRWMDDLPVGYVLYPETPAGIA